MCIWIQFNVSRYICVLLMYYYVLRLPIHRNAISIAREATVFGLVLGTLGRQGSLQIFNHIKNMLNQKRKRRTDGSDKTPSRIVIPFLMAELNPSKMALIKHVQVLITSSVCLYFCIALFVSYC